MKTIQCNGRRLAPQRWCHLLVCITSTLFVLMFIAIVPARAEPLRLGLDIDQGVFITGSSPYTFAAKLAPGIDIGRLRLGLTIGAALTNPKWDAVIGFAPSVVIWPVATSYTGLRFTAEAMYLLRDEWRATGGLVADLDSVRIGEVAGYDSLHRSVILLTTLGIDLPRVFAFLFEKPF